MVVVLYFTYIKPQSAESSEQFTPAPEKSEIASETDNLESTRTPSIITVTPNPTSSGTDINVEEGVTPAAGLLLISANLDTNCRSGPDTSYEIMGHFQRGQTAEVIGSNALQTWWYIKNPNNPTNYCWVWGESTAVQGSTSQLDVIKPPPPPPPKIDFSAEYSRMEDCGVPVAVFRIINDGGLKLESMSLLIYDVTREFQISWMPKINQPFWSKQENCYPDWSYMDVGDTGYIGGDLSTGVLGDKASARIKLCSEDSLDGQCLERTVDFTIPFR